MSSPRMDVDAKYTEILRGLHGGITFLGNANTQYDKAYARGVMLGLVSGLEIQRGIPWQQAIGYLAVLAADIDIADSLIPTVFLPTWKEFRRQVSGE